MIRQRYGALRIIHVIPIVAGIIFSAVIQAAQPQAATRAVLPERHAISGYVLNEKGRGIQAMVFVFDAETGIPYSNITDHPIIDDNGGTHVLSGTDGSFKIPGLFPGSYRFVAQSWEGNQAVKDWLDIKTDTTTLCGVAENINITEHEKPALLILKPAGTVIARVSFEPSDTFLLVSTHPLTGDVMLQSLAWKGGFLKNLVGAMHMRHKQVTMHGLPAGPLYFYTMYDRDGDDPVAFGQAGAVAQAGETIDVQIPLISSRNGEIKIPDRLTKIQAEIKQNPKAFQAAIVAALPPDLRDPRNEFQMFDWPLDREIALPGGQSVTLRDVATLNAYEDFNAEASEWAKRQHASSRPGGD